MRKPHYRRVERGRGGHGIGRSVDPEQPGRPLRDRSAGDNTKRGTQS
jgi:hypothetical protein